MARPLKVGVFLPIVETQMAGVTPRWTDLKAMARTAEEVGLDSVWIPDHLYFEYPGVTESTYECIAMLSALAAVTKRVEIGTLVICTGFRYPAVLASMANTIDEISNGRLILGLGAGYHEPEYRAFGIPYDHRVQPLRGGAAHHRHAPARAEDRFRGEILLRAGVRVPHRRPAPEGPPIMVGTTGERMLRLTAKYADLWNRYLVTGNSNASEIPPLRAAVDAACAEVGRDPATLGRTASVLVDFINRPDVPPSPDRPFATPTPIIGTPEEMAAQLRAFADEGISHIQIWTNPRTVEGVERLGPVLEALDRG